MSFLDQLDHASTQAAAEADIKKLLAGFASDEALRCIQIHEAVLAREPGNWPVRFNLANLLLEVGRNSEAVQNLQMVIAQLPDRPRFRLSLAAALLKAGDRNGALKELQEARRIDPADKEIVRALAGQAAAP